MSLNLKETKMKAAQGSCVLVIPSRIYHKKINYKCYLAVTVLINNEGVKQAFHSEEIICCDWNMRNSTLIFVSLCLSFFADYENIKNFFFKIVNIFNP